MPVLDLSFKINGSFCILPHSPLAQRGAIYCHIRSPTTLPCCQEDMWRDHTERQRCPTTPKLFQSFCLKPQMCEWRSCLRLLAHLQVTALPAITLLQALEEFKQELPSRTQPVYNKIQNLKKGHKKGRWQNKNFIYIFTVLLRLVIS